MISWGSWFSKTEGGEHDGALVVRQVTFTFTNIQNKLTDLCENELLLNDFKTSLWEIKVKCSSLCRTTHWSTKVSLTPYSEI
jgi:hypothetical protein